MVLAVITIGSHNLILYIYIYISFFLPFFELRILSLLYSNDLGCCWVLICHIKYWVFIRQTLKQPYQQYVKVQHDTRNNLSETSFYTTFSPYGSLLITLPHIPPIHHDISPFLHRIKPFWLLIFQQENTKLIARYPREAKYLFCQAKPSLLIKFKTTRIEKIS